MNITALPAEISIADAKLPRSYEQAKTALTACNNIDECLEWSNKAEALASYAKQADDDSLLKYATRIQARAVRRCGELLKQYDGRGAHWENKKDGGGLSISQRAIAGQAGMSERQQKQAVRVANVPEEKFNATVDGAEKVTITKLAAMGKKSRPQPPPPPQGFSQATHLLGAVRRFSEFCAANDAVFVAGGVLPQEAAEVRQQVSAIDGWLDRFVVSLKG